MRHIRLSIDATETHCTGCAAHSIDDYGFGKTGHAECAKRLGAHMPEGSYVRGQPDTWPRADGSRTLRGEKCLAAEAADKARERDAALGAAVRGVIGVLDADRCDRIATDAYAGRTFDTDRKGFAQLMRTIATHLRTEET